MGLFTVVHIRLLVGLCLLDTVRADWWDDFSNNMATDLSPLLALFGEQVTKQFLSESISMLDNFIFAMAPLGIVTAVVSAIRVCGGPSLRAFIGRAQEGGGIAESELCSSTSRDVCELYHNGAIVRVFGRPKILEIVHDRHTTDFYHQGGAQKPRCGIYYFRDYIKTQSAEQAGWEEVKPLIQSDVEDGKPAGEDDKFAPNPNLSLNIGISKRAPYVHWIAAGIGLIAQSSVIVFGGLATYRWRWEKDNALPKAWAFPMMTLGTVLLSCGMFYCTFLVERSTKERVFHKYMGNGESSAVYITQPGNQTIGDQTYDSFAFSDQSKSSEPLEDYITSWKATPTPEDEAKVWSAIFLTMIGFSCQFIGLRAVHSSVSVILLIAIVIMSFIRSGLRTGRLKKEQNLLGDCPDQVEGHELDWLAMRLGHPRPDSDPTFNSNSDIGLSTTSNGLQVSRASWSIVCRPTSLTGSLSGPNELGKDDDDSVQESFTNADRAEDHMNLHIHPFMEDAGSEELRLAEAKWLSGIELNHCSEQAVQPHTAGKLLYFRSRLAELTSHSVEGLKSRSSSAWDDRLIPIRRQARQLKQALETSAQILFTYGKFQSPWDKANSLSWSIDVAATFPTPSATSRTQAKTFTEVDQIHVFIRRVSSILSDSSSRWEVDQNFLESILGLWIWSMISDPDMIRLTPDGAQLSVASEVSKARIIAFAAGEEEIELAKMEFQHWAGERLTSTKSWTIPDAEFYQGAGSTWLVDAGKDVLSSRHGHGVPSDQLIRLFGWPRERLSSHGRALVMSTKLSIASLCAQDVFQSFLGAMLTVLISFGETSTLETTNEVISKLVDSVTESGLGSRQDAYSVVIPAFRRQHRLLLPENILPEIHSFAKKRKRAGHTRQAEQVLRWAWRWGIHSYRTQDYPTEDLAATALELAELYRSAYRQSFVERNTPQYGRARHEDFASEGICLMGEDIKVAGLTGINQLSNIINRYIELRDIWHSHRSAESSTGSDVLGNMAQNKRVWCLYHLSRLEGTYASDDTGRSILSWASQTGWSEVVATSIEMEYPVDSEDKWKRTPLSYAAEFGHSDIIRILLRNKAVPTKKDVFGRTPLSHASENDRVQAITMLIEDQRIDLNAKDHAGWTPLHWATAMGNCLAIKLLGSAIDNLDICSRRPLMIAILNRQEKAAQELVKIDDGWDHYFDGLPSWEWAFQNELWYCGEYLLRSRPSWSSFAETPAVVAFSPLKLPHHQSAVQPLLSSRFDSKFMTCEVTEDGVLEQVTSETLRRFIGRQCKVALWIAQSRPFMKSGNRFDVYEGGSEMSHSGVRSINGFTYALRTILRSLEKEVGIPEDVVMTAFRDHNFEILRLLLKEGGNLSKIPPEILGAADFGVESQFKKLEYVLEHQQQSFEVSEDLFREVVGSRFCNSHMVSLLLSRRHEEVLLADELSLAAAQMWDGENILSELVSHHNERKHWNIEDSSGGREVDDDGDSEDNCDPSEAVSGIHCACCGVSLSDREAYLIEDRENHEESEESEKREDSEGSDDYKKSRDSKDQKESNDYENYKDGKESEGHEENKSFEDHEDSGESKNHQESEDQQESDQEESKDFEYHEDSDESEDYHDLEVFEGYESYEDYQDYEDNDVEEQSEDKGDDADSDTDSFEFEDDREYWDLCRKIACDWSWYSWGDSLHRHSITDGNWGEGADDGSSDRDSNSEAHRDEEDEANYDELRGLEQGDDENNS